MTKKILTLGVALVMGLVLFTGCVSKYNAVIVDSGLTFKEDFLRANLIYGVDYLNENYDANAEEPEDEYLRDETAPDFRTYIITEKTKLDKVFTVFPQIDLDKEMVVMYAYSSVNTRSRKIKSVKTDGENLTIKFKTDKAKSGKKDATAPHRRFLVIKMDRLDITKVEFVKI